MKRLLVGFIFAHFISFEAYAGFERWTSETKKNPFSGGVDVSAIYSVSRNSQVQVQCDSGKQGISIVAIPGYEATSDSLSVKPVVRFAVDGNIILSDIPGNTATFGANLLGVVVKLTKEHAEKLTVGLVKAKRQIAIEDGMSTKPFLLNARGSTAAAEKIKRCYQSQKGAAPDPIADDEVGKAGRVAEILLEIEKLKAELKELMR